MKARLRDKLETMIKTHKLAPIVLEKKHYVKPSLERKRVIIDEVKKLLTTYRTLIILDNTNVPSKFYTYIRQNYGHIFHVKMVKNTLLLKALKELQFPNVDELAKYMKGSTVTVLTNLNPFEAKKLLDRIVVSCRAKAGEKVEYEIVVPPMKTELKPGPIMSLFGKLKIPIQVRDGVIWIMREASIAKPGDVITPELMSLFERLGIEPKFIKPKIKVAYEKGILLPPEQLIIDFEGTKSNVINGVKTALSLAIEVVIPEPNIVTLAISRAHAKACSLAVELGVVVKETAPLVFATALRKAYTLASLLAQKIPELIQITQPVSLYQVAEVKEEKVEKEISRKEEEGKEVAEEQLAEGLATLFG